MHCRYDDDIVILILEKHLKHASLMQCLISDGYSLIFYSVSLSLVNFVIFYLFILLVIRRLLHLGFYRFLSESTMPMDCSYILYNVHEHLSCTFCFINFSLIPLSNNLAHCHFYMDKFLITGFDFFSCSCPTQVSDQCIHC